MAASYTDDRVAAGRSWGKTAGELLLEVVDKTTTASAPEASAAGGESIHQQLLAQHRSAAPSLADPRAPVAAAVGSCPNRSNPHHTCTEYCTARYGAGGGGGGAAPDAAAATGAAAKRPAPPAAAAAAAKRPRQSMAITPPADEVIDLCDSDD